MNPLNQGHRREVRAATCCYLVLLLACLTGCASVAGRTSPASSPRSTQASSQPDPQRGAAPATPSSPGSALSSARSAIDGLHLLAVKGRAPMTGYDRDRFGQEWLDADRNGCDTRNDTLAAGLHDVVLAPGTHDCVVLSGVLDDAYTATEIHFVRGDGFLVDVDHVVSLGNAWATGAFAWDIKKRAALANDPLNLLPVDASANRQKGDGDAATWLPANRGFRCAYVAIQVAVKVKYGLWVTPPENLAMKRVLADCPGQPMALDSGAPTRVDLDITDPSSSPTVEQTGTTTGSSPGGTSYANCDAARAAGAAPVHAGDPGYGTHLDGDGDGIACE